MASILGQKFGSQAQASQPQNGISAMIGQINRLRQMVGGNPAERVPMLLKQWGMSDAQIQQYQAQATQIMKSINGGR